MAAREDLSKDNAVSILPRVLTESENHEINLGTEQRARAIHAFLKDYYSGGTRWKKIIPEEVLQKIIQRNGFEGMEKYVDPNNINFPYAVDLVRDANGKWRPLEDNPGYYGGPGDILKVREILKKRAPEMAAAVKAIDDPLDYPKNLLENIRKEVGPDGLVVFATQNFLTSDHEDKRMEGIFKKLGVEVFDPYDRRGYSNGSKMLVRKDGVYLKQAGEKSARKVDFVILNLEPGTWDYVPLAFRKMAILETADWYLEDSDPNKKRHISLEKKEKIKKALLPDEKTGQVDHEKVQSTMKSLGLETTLDGFPKGDVPNLWDAVRKGKVKTNYSPGIDFVGDKEFYVYVDELIRQYLYEEPIFENVKTVSLATKDKKGKWIPNEEHFADLKTNKDKYVLKVVDGRGGEGIYVGPKISQEEWEKGIAEAHKSPERFQRQDVLGLSRVEDNLTDMRSMAYVLGEQTIISQTKWSRGIPLAGDGKVNLSASGFEYIVMVVKDPKSVGRKPAKMRAPRKIYCQVFFQPSL